MRSLFVFILFFPLLVTGQQEFNQLDGDGNRHGPWQKFHKGTKQLRYEGTFDHGKEVGEFRFYCVECGSQPSVIKQFSKNSDRVAVSYFTPKGLLVSKGQMSGRDRVGEWVYFHKGTEVVMTREFYLDGKLDGTQTTYYPNGKITEELNYKGGSKEGANAFYSPDGVLLKDLNYTNDLLHGPATYFDAQGRTVIKGQYKAGKKDGLWTYYAEGKLVSEERFPKPRKKQGQ